MVEAPLLRFGLADGRPATLLLGEAATVLSVDETLVSSWDLSGRPYALVRDEGTYRRGLDGRLLHKREATAEGPRVRRRLFAADGEPVVEAARREAQAALAALATGGVEGDVLPRRAEDGSLALEEHPVPEAVRRLRLVASLDEAALRADAERFLAVCGRVGILPPDQYLSLAVRVTEGCSWNACTFCSLYRGIPFRAKDAAELRAHVRALQGYFGASLALRRSVFLGDANALCLAEERLLPLLEVVAAELPGAPLFSFVDAWTGARKTGAEWRACARLGLRRVYVGLETGDPALLSWLGKPGSREDAVDLVLSLRDAGVAAGVIVLVGAGGRRFADAHVAATARALTLMRLGPDDLVYFSELLEEPGLEYGLRAADEADLHPLEPAACARQRAAILSAFHARDPARPPRVATYDIRELVY